jgi:hypothetical protein
MGQSTDAILCYGMLVASETIEDWEEQPDEAGDEAEKKRNPLGYMAWMGEGETIDGVEVKLVSHCSSDYPEYIVAIAESEMMAWRGNPKPVLGLTTRPEWDAAIRKFIEKYGVELEENEHNDVPRWWIASDWS